MSHPDNFNNFLSEAECKTPPTTICEIDEKGKILESINVPAGFQLDCYLKSLYPQHSLHIYGSRYDGKDVLVYELLQKMDEINNNSDNEKYQLFKTYIKL